jgi:hypothetical protein
MTTFIDSVWVVVDRHTLTAHSYIRRKVADMTGGQRHWSRHCIGSVARAPPLFAVTRVNDDSGELLQYTTTFIDSLWVVVNRHTLTAHVY